MPLHVPPVIPGAPNRPFGNRVGIPRPPVHGCELPKNPFPHINPTNPIEWYGAAGGMLTAAQKLMACTEAKLTESIINGTGEPNMLRHLKFIAAALIGRMRDLQEYAIQMQKDNLKAEKATHELALAAR